MILPLLLLLFLGIIEVARLMAIFSSVSSAARQAARYGSVGGDSGNGMLYYEDCAGMRGTAKNTSLLQPLSDSNISISYDRGVISPTIGLCATGSLTPTLSESIQDGDRVVISITTIYRPLVPIVPLPPIPINFVAAHTIFPEIIGPTPSPIPNPDLSLTKTGFPNPVMPAGILTYTLLVNNNGPVAASSIVVTDTIPGKIDLNSVITPTLVPTPGVGWVCGGPDSSRLITCTLPSLATGPAAPIVLQVSVPFTTGVVTNTANVTDVFADPLLSNNFATASVVITPAIDLELHKYALLDTVGAGTPLTYAITVHDNGAVDATQVIVTDTLPADAPLLSYTNNAFWTCAPGTGSLVCRMNGSSTLPIGTTAPTITVVIAAPLPGFVPRSGFITNMVSASSQLADPFPANSTNVAVTTTVTTNADLHMFKFGPDTVFGGSIYVYTLRVINNGPSVASSVTVADTVPANVAGMSWGADWSNCKNAGNKVTCTYGSNLVVNATTSDIVISATAPLANVQLVNTASVSSGQPDQQPLNNTASVTTTVNNCSPGVVSASASTVSASPPSVFANNSSTSQVTVALIDGCGNPVTSQQVVTLNSSRGGQDTISPNPVTTSSSGTATFLVKSGTPGTSTYSATVNGVTLAATAQVNYYGCVNLGQLPLGSSGQQFVQYSVGNPSGFSRRLTNASLSWPGGGHVLSLALLPKTIWSGSTANNPFVIPSGGINWQGTNTDRTLSNGANNQTLQFNFDFSVFGTGAYNLNTTWDDGSGGRVCTASINVGY